MEVSKKNKDIAGLCVIDAASIVAILQKYQQVNGHTDIYYKHRLYTIAKPQLINFLAHKATVVTFVIQYPSNNPLPTSIHAYIYPSIECGYTGISKACPSRTMAM